MVGSSYKSVAVVMAAVGGAIGIGAPLAGAAVTLGTNTAIGASFPATANGASLKFASTSSATGATLASGAAQGVGAGTAIGEIFTGVSGALNAIDLVDSGGGGGASYRPFLFDLGPGTFNAGSNVFNPSLHANLLSSTTLTPGPSGGAVIEFDFTGADSVSLVSTDNYAFGIYNTNNSGDLNLERSSGVQSDPNGDGFTISGDPATATTDNASPFSGSVRNVFVGVYTTSVPEPASMGLVGIGLVSLCARRSRKA